MTFHTIQTTPTIHTLRCVDTLVLKLYVLATLTLHILLEYKNKNDNFIMKLQYMILFAAFPSLTERNPM